MPAPTALPSGNELRDQCVTALLRDKIGASFLERLLALPAYEALLPELVFQDISIARPEPIDHLMAKILSGAASNPLHAFLAKTYRRIFTTNFEMCLESAGANNVLHLHGHIGEPSSLQNRLFRLGKTAAREYETFVTALSDGELLVIGYSMRDQDILEAIETGNPRRIYFLSRQGDLPEFLTRFKGEAIYTIGDAGELFGLTFPTTTRNKQHLVSARPPDVAFRAQGIINLSFRAGQYGLAAEIFDVYQPYLKGAPKYQIMGAVANCLRIDRQFEKARQYYHRIVNARIYRDPSRLFILSTAYVGLGLCLMDADDGQPDEAEAYYLAALNAMERFAGTERAKSQHAAIEIWKARILNNLGLVKSKQRHWQEAELMFRDSMELKNKNHEEVGWAQSCANLAKVYYRMERISELIACLIDVSRVMSKNADRYLCRDLLSSFDWLIANRPNSISTDPDKWQRIEEQLLYLRKLEQHYFP